MKKIFLLCLLVISFCAKAQFVTIPDANFRNALIQLYPSCFNGAQEMDTTCSEIVNEIFLDVSSQNITDLTGIQYFDGLNILYCYNNQLTNLPTLPSLLTVLWCNENKLYSLPVLPISLTDLWCDNNFLSSLPILPSSLTVLFCYGNQLTNLPSLPLTLTNLECHGNQLTYLPTLPVNLTNLRCNNNLFSSLPSLPNSLTYLGCYNNPFLTCLPLLPDSLISIQIDLNITCLPNIPPGLFTTLPICPINSSCETKPTVSGLVFHDINSNGIYDFGIDTTLKGWVVSNTNGWAASSMQNGEYITKLDSGVVNTLTLSLPYIQSITPNNYQITPSSSGSQGSNYDFSVKYILNVQDLRLDIATGSARPGFDQWANVSVNNIGTKNINNASLKVLKPSTFTFINSYPSISQQVGDTLIWNNINIGVLQYKGFNINWNIPANSVLGTPYQIQAWINPISTDTTPANNQVVWDEIFQGSFDPNDKSVNSEFLDPTMLDNELKYTIRFQNTGTDTAFIVMIRDTLSNNLDMSTFRILGASHNYSFIVRDHSLLEVFFQNILLPDSFTNEPKSHGFVQYSVKPKSTLAVGVEINNTAYIYFDFNTPIVTNTTNTRIVTTSISEGISIDANIYPNPNNGKVILRLRSVTTTEPATLTIQDLNGRVLMSLMVKDGQEVDLGGLTSGMYLAKIETRLGSKRMKLVKE